MIPSEAPPPESLRTEKKSQPRSLDGSEPYARARAGFLQAAEGRGLRTVSHPIDARSERGEELSIDVAYLGPESPRSVIAVSSGLHGAEGFAGSAIQHQLLDTQLDGLELAPDCGLLLVHALNPYGFAVVRRVNESNVDLNRNFLRHPEGHVSNPGYEELYDAINPETLHSETLCRSENRLAGLFLSMPNARSVARTASAIPAGTRRSPESR